MAIFEIRGADGIVYEVDAPDEKAALGGFQRMMSAPYQPGNITFTEGDTKPGVQGYSREISPEEFAKDDAEIAAKRAQAAKPSTFERVMRGVDDAVRSVASGMTFGLADEIVAGGKAALGQGSYGENVAQERARDAEISPWLRIPAEIAGGVATGTGLARGGLTLLNATKPTMGSMVGRGAAEGAGYGALSGFGHGEGLEDSLAGAGRGAVVGGALGAGAGVVGAKMAQGTARKAIPAKEALKEQSSAAYDAARKAGLTVTPESFDNAIRRIGGKAIAEGIDKDLHPMATAALRRLMGSRGKPLTLPELDTLRQILRDAASSNSAGERRIAKKLVEKFDDYLNDLTPKDVKSADALRAVPALNKARDLWSRFRKAEVVEGLVERARTRAAGQFSGSGFENALRTEFRQLALNERRMRTFTREEQEAIRRVANGGKLENFMRFIGRFAPTGVVSAAGGAYLGGTIGGTLGGTVGAAALPAIGLGARGVATAMTNRNAQAVSDLIRSGGVMPPPSLTPGQLSALQGMLLGGAEQGHHSPLPFGLLSPGR